MLRSSPLLARACALALAEGGLRVVLHEARELAGGASGRNGGFALRGGAMAYDRAREWLGPEPSRAFWQWTERSLEDLANVAGDALEHTGSLRLAADDDERTELRDEYDAAEEPQFEKLSESEYIVDARMSLDDLDSPVDVELPSDEADTLGGFIYEFLGKVPDAGETIQTEHLKLVVMSVTDNRIGKVRVRLIEGPADKSPQDNTTQKNGTTHGPQDRD